MRHDVRLGAALLAQTLPLAPALRSRGMRQAPAAAVLVAPGRLARRALSGCARAVAPAVALPAVAAAAQHHRHAAARAHEQSARRLGQGHAPRQENTPPRAARANAHSVRCWTPCTRQCNTGTAPAASPRGVGHGAAPSCQAMGSRPVPAYDSGPGRRSTAAGQNRPSLFGVGLPARAAANSSDSRPRGRSIDPLAEVAFALGPPCRAAPGRNHAQPPFIPAPNCTPAHRPDTEPPPRRRISAVPDRRSQR